ncbi:MAG: sensor histidine kinase, partial [Lachnospiraceae bacterium]|nr:sensor histidine kinase [Lachnospiraceae bacterium]
LYILIKKKCWEIQSNYEKLLQVTRLMAEGDLNVSTEEDMGLFNPIRDELTDIRNGFQKAVNNEVRSQNMKTELITNVSHDLKTPLTAIITYVDLLKKEDITDEERKNYIETLDKKSQRLKVLIEDLFEVSKATSDNIVMNFDEVDLVSLIKQVRLENEDKIAESTLDFRWNFPREKCILTLDPQRTFRVIDNLVQNILKYSMPHSRVYIDMRENELEVIVSFKNMSATEMNFSPEEITERFVRGDLSRNTEGSGLGLAIAQSFTELQNGTFKVETDGDLFKVTIIFKK